MIRASLDYSGSGIHVIEIIILDVDLILYLSAGIT